MGQRDKLLSVRDPLERLLRAELAGATPEQLSELQLDELVRFDRTFNHYNLDDRGLIVRLNTPEIAARFAAAARAAGIEPTSEFRACRVQKTIFGGTRIIDEGPVNGWFLNGASTVEQTARNCNAGSGSVSLCLLEDGRCLELGNNFQFRTRKSDSLGFGLPTVAGPLMGELSRTGLRMLAEISFRSA